MQAHEEARDEVGGPEEREFVQKVEDDLQAVHGELVPEIGYHAENARRVLKTYYHAIDKKGFVFDFDVVWPWAEYSTKGNAKAVIKGVKNKDGSWRTKPLLRENIDYQVTRLGLISEESGIKIKGKRGGDRKTEKIMLSARGFSQFALSARTPAGQILRDVVFSAMRIMKQLQEAVQAGTHRIVRVRPDGDDMAADVRGAKRLKVCESTKALMREMVDTDPEYARLCGRINGETNKAATGRYKYELAKELGKPAKHVNARDYMTPAQLAVAEAIEIISREEVKTTEDPFAAHKDICTRLVANIKDKLHGRIAEEPLRLREARKATNALEAPHEVAGQKKKKRVAVAKKVQDQSTHNHNHNRANTINNYFFAK